MRYKTLSAIAATTLLVACGSQSPLETKDSGSESSAASATIATSDTLRPADDASHVEAEETASSTSPHVLAATVVGPQGAPPPIAPSGENNYELFTTKVSVVLRPGESRAVPITVRNVGLLGAVWTVRTEDFRTPSGVSVTGLPESVDLTSEAAATVMIELTADATATPGDFGSYLIVFDDPTAPNVRAYGAGAPVTIDIVGSSALIGPAAASDIVESPAVGVIFDPTINDVEGDAPLDSATLSIVDPPDDGTLVVTGDGQLSYVPGPLGEDAAVYQICDTNNICANATLTIYQVPA